MSIDPRFATLALEALAKLVLRQEQYSLRVVAMRELAMRIEQQPESLPVLAAALTDVEPSVRRRAAQTLGSCKEAGRSLVQELCWLFSTDPIWTVREAAINAVRALCWPSRREESSTTGIVVLLIECVFTDREPLVREAAIQGLAACLNDEVVLDALKNRVIWDRLRSGMDHAHASRRSRAVTALCQLGAENPLTYSAISRGLQDSHWKVRRTTAWSIGENPELVFSEFGSQVLLPELIKRRFDQHRVVNLAVHQTLDQCIATWGNEPRVGFLRLLTSHPSAVVTLRKTVQQENISILVKSEFRKVLANRKAWHESHFPQPNEAEAIDSENLEIVTDLVLDQAVTWKAGPKDAVQEKEAAWLLARLAELMFTHITAE